MPPAKTKERKSKSSKGTSKSSSSSSSSSPTSLPPSSSQSAGKKLPSSGFLLTCDVPTKQFIKHLNETKSVDKKFILEDLDATHLLIDGNAKEEICKRVEDWMDENVFSNVERVGENLET